MKGTVVLVSSEASNYKDNRGWLMSHASRAPFCHTADVSSTSASSSVTDLSAKCRKVMGMDGVKIQDNSVIRVQ